MKTRMELWKNYRNEINKNISLQKAVQISNEKLNVLHKRLLKVFPEYDKKYKNKIFSLKVDLEKVDSLPKYSSQKLNDLLNKIDKFEEEDNMLSLIDKISFSSEEMNDVISSMKKGKVKRIKYMNKTKTGDILIEKPKTIKLNNKIQKINIAIDGPSGTGKSSAAKSIAQKYNLIYVNTGLVYRAIALNCINKNIDVENEGAIIPTLKKDMIKLLKNEKIFLNQIDVTKEVRSDKISIAASKISQIPKVREYAVIIQKAMAKNKNVIMDGRDTTFVILPNAELKIYLDTKVEIRAKRRLKQNKKLGFETNYEKILQNIKERDLRDISRSKDPLHKTKDAILIDASNMTLEEVVEKISSLIDKKINKER